MHRHIAPIVLCVSLFAAACDSGSAGGATPRPTETATTAAPTFVPAADAVAQAQAIVGREFGDTGWIDSIVNIEAVDGLLRVTLDRATFTLSDLDAYARMCQALTDMISSEQNPRGVAGVQFFRADGTPVVAGDTPGARCHSFSP